MKDGEGRRRRERDGWDTWPGGFEYWSLGGKGIYPSNKPVALSFTTTPNSTTFRDSAPDC